MVLPQASGICSVTLLFEKEKPKPEGASSTNRDHIKDTGHSAFLDNFCIIDRTNNELDLLIHKIFRAPQVPFVYFSSLSFFVTYSLLMLVLACLPYFHCFDSSSLPYLGIMSVSAVWWYFSLYSHLMVVPPFMVSP